MTIINKNIENIIQDNMMNYSSYVLLNRALPDLRDGLKPVHRRILYSMYYNKNFKLTKSANASGEVMRFHPHGDSYPTMAGMTQKDRHANPWLIGKGNCGSYLSRDLESAASRYTDVKLSDISIDMMKDFDKNIVDFIDNYDGTIKMPEVMPVKFPAILAYAQSGIGVGFASSTPSFNITELCESFIKYIKTNEKTVLVPDFPTGGMIVENKEMFEQINETGRGSIRIRAKAEINKNEIIVTEIPYTTTREAIIEKIEQLAKQGKLNEVSDIKDLTGLAGMKISIKTRKNSNMEELLEKLFRLTPLESSHSSNMNILINGLPRVMGVWQIADEWIKWRRSSIERSLVYDIKTMKNKLHILKGLEKVLINIDKSIDIIRKSPEEKVEANLMKEFNIDKIQATEVSNMKLRNINKDYIVKKIKDIQSFEDKIEKYKKIVKSEKDLNDIVIEGLEETILKYGKDRQSIMNNLEDAPTVNIEDDIPNYPVFIYLTEDGYAYKFKNDQKPTLKPGDKIQKVFEATNDSEVLVFGDDRFCHKVALKDIEDTRANQLGTYLPNIIRDNNINIINYSILDEKQKFIMMVYTNNRISKVNLEAFKGARSILRNSYCLKQELADMFTLEKDIKIKVKNDKGTLTINTKDYKLTNGRNATGVYISPSRKLIKVEIA